MFLNRKKPADKNEADKQKIIAFKKFFAENEGREIFIDLMNRFHVLNPTPKADCDFDRGVAEGQRRVVLHIMNLFYTDLAQFEKILKGDFT